MKLYLLILLISLCINISAQNLKENISLTNETSLFLSGMYYHQKGNDSIKLETFKFLYNNEGFRIVLEDIPLSAAYFLQKYYDTENELFFQETLKRSCITNFEWGYFDPQIWFDFYKSLPADEKFVIKGIGIEYPQWISIVALHDIISKYEIPQELEQMLKHIHSLYNMIPDKDQKVRIANPCYVHYNDLIEPFLHIEKTLNENEELCKELFREDFYYLSRIVKSVIIYISNIDSKKHNVQDSVLIDIIFRNILELTKDLPAKKKFGQIGNCSAAKNSCNGSSYNLAKVLNEDISSPYVNKVESAIIYYKNNRKLKNAEWTKEQQKFLDSMESRNNLYIYKIKPDDTLFKEKQEIYDFIIINDFK